MGFFDFFRKKKGCNSASGLPNLKPEEHYPYYRVVQSAGELERADYGTFDLITSFAYQYLKKLFDECDMNIIWLQSKNYHPSFQHICFSFNNCIFSVLLGLENSEEEQIRIMVYQEELRRQLSECAENNLIPCILPFNIISKASIIAPYMFIDSRTGKEFDVRNHLPLKDVKWSDWEYHTIGLSFAIDYIKKKGFKIINACNIVGMDPQIIAIKDEKEYYFLINTYDRNEPVVYEMLYDFYSTFSDRQGFYLELSVESTSNTALKNKTIIRGDDVRIDFIGITQIEKAMIFNDWSSKDGSTISLKLH